MKKKNIFSDFAYESVYFEKISFLSFYDNIPHMKPLVKLYIVFLVKANKNSAELLLLRFSLWRETMLIYIFQMVGLRPTGTQSVNLKKKRKKELTIFTLICSNLPSYLKIKNW